VHCIVGLCLFAPHPRHSPNGLSVIPRAEAISFGAAGGPCHKLQRLHNRSNRRNHWGMPALTRRRNPEAPNECWQVFMVTSRVGTIALRTETAATARWWADHHGNTGKPVQDKRHYRSRHGL
jgi:hypothetical protein